MNTSIISCRLSRMIRWLRSCAEALTTTVTLNVNVNGSTLTSAFSWKPTPCCVIGMWSSSAAGVTKYRIGRTGPVRQGKLTHWTDRTLCRLLRLGLRLGELGLGCDASVRVIFRSHMGPMRYWSHHSSTVGPIYLPIGPKCSAEVKTVCMFNDIRQLADYRPIIGSF